MRRPNHGFTVLEVLVVSVIIIALTSILTPFFFVTRENGRTSACLSNCRQIAFAIHMYLDDHDRELPSSCMTQSNAPQMSDPQSWLVAVQPYVRTQDAYRCPDDSSPLWTSPEMPRRSSYAINGYFIPTVPPYYGVGLSQVVAPQRCIVATEIADTWLGDAFLPMYWGPRPRFHDEDAQASEWDSVSGEPTGLAIRRHRQGANYIFADCHARWHFFRQTFMQASAGAPSIDWFDPERP